MNTERVPLSEYLQAFRIDRPSEWQMDSFIERAEALQKRIEELEAQVNSAFEQAAKVCERDIYQQSTAGQDVSAHIAKAIRALKAGDVQAPKEG